MAAKFCYSFLYVNREPHDIMAGSMAGVSSDCVTQLKADQSASNGRYVTLKIDYPIRKTKLVFHAVGALKVIE